VKTDREKIRRAWEAYIAGIDSEPKGIRSVVRDSWLRCRRHGIELTTATAPIVLSLEELQAERRKNGLYEAALPVLGLLRNVLAGRHFLLILCDAECRLLETMADVRTLESSEAINAVPGSQWLEQSMGTDASPCSLLLDSPVEISWFEHYLPISQCWTGSAAPIHDPFAGRAVGTIALYGCDTLAHSKALELVRRAALMIENGLHANGLTSRFCLFEYYNSYRHKFPSNDLVALDTEGRIVVASPKALDRLGLRSNTQSSRVQPSLIQITDPLLLRQTQGEGVRCEIDLRTDHGEFLKAALVSVRNGDTTVGFLATLRFEKPGRSRVAPPSPWSASYEFSDIAGESERIKSAIAQAQRLAQLEAPILLEGESGTGKELFAHALHNGSVRRDGPFIPLNCGGMNEELLTAELFGYVEGAFTGALRGGKAGKLELADHGTLFLDESEAMSPRMQLHLLRGLEEGRVTRIGDIKPRTVDVRVISASNCNLESRVGEGTFREDLYYRLAALIISLPPLRERSSDIPILVDHLLQRAQIRIEVTSEAMARLKEYCWPGNIRQLRNVLLQAVGNATSGTISETDLPPLKCPGQHHHPASSGSQDGAIAISGLKMAEKEAIVTTLALCHGNVARAAKFLNVHRVTLHRKIEKLGIKAQRLYTSL
jgi:transcriptional regulator of acetoin/glycerol metabolism